MGESTEAQQQQQKKGGRKESQTKTRKAPILDLEKYVDQKLHIKYHGGRQVIGILKGYDPLQNLVLDETIELLRDPSDETVLTGKTRKLGLVVCRGPSIVTIYPEQGTESIPNPFV